MSPAALRVGVHDQRTALRDHWYARPGWGPDGTKLAWHLTLAGGSPLAALADTLRPTLTRDHLRPVAPPWWHLSIADVDADAARTSDLPRPEAPPGTLTFAEASVAAEGVVLEGVPDAWADWLTAVRDAVAPARAGDPPPWPHVSLAYSTGPEPVGPLVADLRAALAGLPAVDAGRPRLALLRVRPAPPSYVWEVLSPGSG